MKHTWVFLILVILGASACQRKQAQSVPAGQIPAEQVPVEQIGVTAVMSVASTGFSADSLIPKKFTCDGEDLSPPLHWSDVPRGTKSFALICDDPDAPGGTWVHWVMWGIPAESIALPEGLKSDSSLPGEGHQGTNSWGKTGYGGPCPPRGKPHRYYFKVYALDTMIQPAGAPNKAAVEKAMQGHILAQAQIMGKYGR